MTPTLPTTPQRFRTGLTLLDGLICLYLVLPLLLFCAWFKWPAAIALAALTCYGVAVALRGTQWRRVELGRRTLACIAIVSLGWTALSGVGHFVYANLDWVTRDAVLRDLTVTPWPPMYAVSDGTPAILRAPVGYYLPPAAAGSLLGLPAANLLLYLWTALGFGLVLWAAMSLFPTRRERLLCAALMLGFGGLDLVGYLLLRGQWPSFAEHVEWWARFAQYSGNSTLMFWVPNHALPAWLGLMLALRHWRQADLARITLMLASSIALWSPLAAVGLVPFFLAALNWRRDLGVVLSARSGLPFLGLAALVSRYMTMDTQSIGHGWAIDIFPSAAMFWSYYGLFCLLEFGLLVLLLAWLRSVDLKVGIAVVILLLLPFYRFGPGNDLVMRSSIPALAILALACVRPLAASPNRTGRAALGVILALGALGAAQEPERALLARGWDFADKSLVQVSVDPARPRGVVLPPNYVGRLNQPGLLALMRAPAMVMPGLAASAPSAR